MDSVDESRIERIFGRPLWVFRFVRDLETYVRMSWRFKERRVWIILKVMLFE